MARETRVWVGGGILLAGLAFWAARLGAPPGWRLAGATLLALAGLAALWRAGHLPAGGAVTWRWGDLTRQGTWAAQNEQLWAPVGDVLLDLTAAQWPADGSVIACRTLVGAVSVVAPGEVAVTLEASLLTGEVRVGEQRETLLLRRGTWLLPATGGPARRLTIQVAGLVADIHIARA